MADINNNQQGGRTTTSTQIRNMYSEGMSYLNIKFFNVNLSFQFSPFASKDATGRSTYDQQKALMTTVNFEGAFALYKTASDIINGNTTNEVLLKVPCAGGAALTLERKLGLNGQMETFFIITKNNNSIPFKFNTLQIQVKENGQMITKIVETGLGTFTKTIEGYLVGINSDRHLDKLTEDFIKSKEGQQGNNSFQTNSGYQSRNNNSGGYKKPWNNNRKPYNNNYNNPPQQQNSWETKPNQQNMSSYNIPG